MSIEMQVQNIQQDTVTNDSLAHTQHQLSPDEQAARRQKNEAARRLLHEWLADESGYDEEVWPQVKQIIEDNRMSMRSRFGD
jgi:hypothetical protein